MYIMSTFDDTLHEIMSYGERRTNRTGVDTLSVFGHKTEYEISEYFPVLTKRQMYPMSIFKELLWMISGSSNVNDLEKMGSKIWTAWRDKDFENKHGYEDGEFGPIYGWQLRHFGGDYKTKTGGFDQLNYVLNELKTNKSSRRILFTYWNAPDVTSDKVRLPPCHHTFQLNVDNNDNLSGLLFQRSADWFVGSPANIQFYSTLIYMLAQQCNLKPKKLVYVTADTHIYVNQIPAIEEYLSRREFPSQPKLVLNKAKDLFSYVPDDFKLIDYNPLSKIAVPVAV